MSKAELISILVAAFGILVPLFVLVVNYYRKVYLSRPELSIELKSNGGSSHRVGVSNRTDTSKGFIDASTAIFITEYKYDFQFIITNNSEVLAYYPEMEFHNKKKGFSRIDKLEKYTPIKSNDKITLNGCYIERIESDKEKANELGGLPEHLSEIIVVLKYQNSYKKKFYTIFRNSKPGEKNEYKRKLIKNYR